MTDHLAEALDCLRPHCHVVQETPVNGWEVDCWCLSDDAIAALGAAYRLILQPSSIDSDVVHALAIDGIDLGTILLDDERADDTITRSDMTELAGAVALAVVEGMTAENMHLPNVPKGQRNASTPGIDIVAAKLDEHGALGVLGDDEFVLVCSVKHTIVDPADLRAKLARSTSTETLSVAYLGSQLRLLDGKLALRGPTGGRVFLALKSGCPGRNLRVMGVAAVDAESEADLTTQLNNLPGVSGWCTLRKCLVTEIHRLHELADQ